MRRNLLSYLPIISGMADTDVRNHADAIRELSFSVILGTSPIWLGSFIAFAVDPNMNNTFNDYVKVLGHVTRQGQLFIYASATLGPVFYIIIREWKDGKLFPSRYSLLLLVIIVLIISFAFYGVQTANVWVDPEISFPLSIGLFLTSILLLYIVKVYDNARMPDLSARTREEEEAFTTGLRERRE